MTAHVEQGLLPAPLDPTKTYETLLGDIGVLVEQTRITTAIEANRTVSMLHWFIGRAINAQAEAAGWGAKVITRLAHDLAVRFPDSRGFSSRNLKYMRQFAAAYPEEAVVYATFSSLPWSTNLLILERVPDDAMRRWYAERAYAEGWSKNVLALQIDQALHKRLGGASTNFARTLPALQSDLVQQLFKEHYAFDFVNLPEGASERAVERGLVANFRAFLQALGRGFAFMGSQFRLNVGDQEFFLDLLFFHVPTNRFVVFDLKIGDFQPEFAGKMGFYVSAVDAQLRNGGPSGELQHQETIGIVLCKRQNHVVVEYTLRGITAPIGVATYSTVPAEIQRLLPSPLELEDLFFRAERAADGKTDASGTGSIGAIIPKDMASRQHLTANDEVFAAETADGILLTAVDPTTQAAMEAYTELAKENRAAMAALAKL